MSCEHEDTMPLTHKVAPNIAKEWCTNCGALNVLGTDCEDIWHPPKNKEEPKDFFQAVREIF